jgi:hypothetical protein
LMYTNLKVKGLGGFGNGLYWCSTARYVIYAWSQRFNAGNQDYYNKNSELSVRAVRAF